MKSKKNLIIIAIVIAISLFGIAYAFFDYYKLGDIQMISAGAVNLLFEEGEDTINLSNVFPESVEKARSKDNNFVTFTVSGMNTTTDQDIYYEIMLNNGDPEEGMTRFNPEHLVFDLVELNADGTEGKYLVNAQSYSDFNARRIWVNTVDRKTATTVSKTYKLRMWLNENVWVSDTNPKADYPSTGYENYYASVKVSVYGDFVEKHLHLIGYIYYDMSSLGLGNQNIPFYEEQTVKVTNEVPVVEGYKFLGWSTTLNGEVVYQAGAVIDANEIVNNLTLYPVMRKLVVADKIMELLSLTDPDDDGVRFVYGNAKNNYVWYSGKLWRIVSIDSDGNIKLVTHGSMTSITWNATGTSTDYSTSQVRTWLNEEFLPTLHNSANFLVDYEWDYSSYDSFPNKKNSENVKKLEGANAEKVGLLNVYEYMKTGGFGITSYNCLGNFLTANVWWTMSPKVDGSSMWTIDNYGYATAAAGNVSYGYGVRPSVVLKFDIQFSNNGDGTRTNPYLLEGDKIVGTNLELLSNRISGEYISFNNVKYRIIGIEKINGQTLAKVTMADYGFYGNSLSSTHEFDTSANGLIYNTNTGVGKYLLDWYNATSASTTYSKVYIANVYKKMIATENEGVVWYTGAATSSYDYKLSKSGITVSTPIGLGYYGELFSSQYGDGYCSSEGSGKTLWLITRYSDTMVWTLLSSGATFETDEPYRYLRPLFYLKSDVRIGDTNGDGKVGTGMPHDPYEIVQLSE